MGAIFSGCAKRPKSARTENATETMKRKIESGDGNTGTQNKEWVINEIKKLLPPPDGEDRENCYLVFRAGSGRWRRIDRDYQRFLIEMQNTENMDMELRAIQN